MVIFPKLRRQLDADACILIKGMPQFPVERDGEQVGILLFRRVFVESVGPENSRIGYFVTTEFEGEGGEGFGHIAAMNVTAFGRSGTPLDSYDMLPALADVDGAFGDDEKRKWDAGFLLRVFALMSRRMEAVDAAAAEDRAAGRGTRRDPAVPTHGADKVEVYARKGDALIYRRLDPVEEGRMLARAGHQSGGTGAHGSRVGVGLGSKHRHHPVRGHYRTYKSGKRVWVRSHHRGDPALGTTTPVFDLAGRAEARTDNPSTLTQE